MTNLMNFVTMAIMGKFARDERGVTMLEYSILLGIITVAAIVAIVFAGGWVGNQWNALTNQLTIAG